MALRTEIYENALFVYSVEMEEMNEGDASAIGISSLIEKRLSDGSVYIKGEFQIKPHCPIGEVDEVKSILLKHISK